jgi:hypothetical protein
MADVKMIGKTLQAFTGVDANVIWAAVAGFALIDLGYLALSIGRRPRWVRALGSPKRVLPRPDDGPGP